jgi:prevent-host-death family protein
MADVSVQDLRNHCGEILDRVTGGEALTVTRHGRPIAELRPLPRSPLQAVRLLQRWRGLPAVDPAELRADLDDYLDSAL